MSDNAKAGIYNILSLLATMQISYSSSVSIMGSNNLVDVFLIVIAFFGFRSVLKTVFEATASLIK
ncbi:hypothetical protein CV016_09820 [Yersinia kristensenii]|uniref:Uncharacterized protein n=1 Tax=Yersinia kristensenii TaxID=28152 RepID=A0A0T9KPA3_YERKR|nr:hypothetical protein [Yersinia kristensenii]OVZ77075.1 hypothetical protein CBW52_20950 [Yersinia kristensenii]PJG63005.1 hypothetical protein CV016_09820 [Yersinia kristensenii]CFR16565.1 Uncharacterised protein [Yersinia kristensenii]CNE17517.1 Uncharacterised protein [Yersinia kristensenii]CNG43295.1 Uncharacterised protein [Yersinia kristensenii]